MAVYGSYIHFRQNLISWKRLVIFPRIALPVIETFPMKEDVCGNGVAIDTVSKSLNAGQYGG